MADINVLQTLIQFRRGTEEEWNLVKDTYIPRAGEPCTTIDTESGNNHIKVGDGVNTWGKLKYIGEGDLQVVKIYGDSTESTETTIDGKTYATVEEAIEAVPDGGTIKMSAGLGANETISADKKFVLDMNSAVIVDNEKNPINTTINGDLTLTGNGSVACNKNGAPSVLNNGSMVIENGNYTHKDEKGDTYYAVLNHGKMTINNGLFNIDGNVSSLVVNGYYDYNNKDSIKGYVEGVNQANPEMVINDGTFITNFLVVKNDDGAKLTINNGKFYGTIKNSGVEMTINNGYFERKWNDLDNLIFCDKFNDTVNAAKTTINGGTFIGHITSNGEMIVKGGKFDTKLLDAFIAEGYEQKLVDGWYVVSKKGE